MNSVFIVFPYRGHWQCSLKHTRWIVTVWNYNWIINKYLLLKLKLPQMVFYLFILFINYKFKMRFIGIRICTIWRKKRNMKKCQNAKQTKASAYSNSMYWLLLQINALERAASQTTLCCPDVQCYKQTTERTFNVEHGRRGN